MTRPGLLACLLLVVVGKAAADEPVAPKANADAIVTVSQVFEKKFPEITLSFVVKAADGTPILDATREDFQVFEYEKPVKITSFHSPISREIVPTTVVLVLDRSGSMTRDNRIGGMRKAVAAFLEQLPQGSKVAVIAFGSDVEEICTFTDDPEKVRSAVDDLIPDGQTRFYDAVLAAIDLLADREGRRAILAMTDGDDNSSDPSARKAAIRAARREGLPVHTVAFGSKEEVETEAVEDLAEQTRGRPFSARSSEDLRDIFEEIARSQSQAYSVSYSTDQSLPDGTLRPIKVAYAKSANVAEASVYIPGMVVPAAGWSLLFLGLVATLGGLWLLPTLFRR